MHTIVFPTRQSTLWLWGSSAILWHKTQSCLITWSRLDAPVRASGTDKPGDDNRNEHYQLNVLIYIYPSTPYLIICTDTQSPTMSDLDLDEIYNFTIKLARDVSPVPSLCDGSIPPLRPPTCWQSTSTRYILTHHLNCPTHNDIDNRNQKRTGTGLMM